MEPEKVGYTACGCRSSALSAQISTNSRDLNRRSRFIVSPGHDSESHRGNPHSSVTATQCARRSYPATAAAAPPPPLPCPHGHRHVAATTGAALPRVPRCGRPPASTTTPGAPHTCLRCPVADIFGPLWTLCGPCRLFLTLSKARAHLHTLVNPSGYACDGNVLKKAGNILRHRSSYNDVAAAHGQYMPTSR